MSDVRAEDRGGEGGEVLMRIIFVVLLLTSSGCSRESDEPRREPFSITAPTGDHLRCCQALGCTKC